jgi:hypothetical protein
MPSVLGALAGAFSRRARRREEWLATLSPDARACYETFGFLPMTQEDADTIIQWTEDELQWLAEDSRAAL